MLERPCLANVQHMPATRGGRGRAGHGSGGSSRSRGRGVGHSGGAAAANDEAGDAAAAEPEGQDSDEDAATAQVDKACLRRSQALVMRLSKKVKAISSARSKHDSSYTAQVRHFNQKHARTYGEMFFYKDEQSQLVLGKGTYRAWRSI